MTQPAQFENLVDMYTRSVEAFANNPRFGSKVNGVWTWINFREFGELVDQFRGGLASLGVGKGDMVAVISNNRVEWAVGAYATYGLGAVYVPMYEKQQPSDWEYILSDSTAKVLIAANDTIAETVRGFMDRIPSLTAVINLAGGKDDAHSYASLLVAGAAVPAPLSDPEPSDLAGLIYTSGTTGKPKGVRLSHDNFTSNVNAVQQRFPMQESALSLSFLPWAHSFGQTAELHTLFSFGGACAINSSLEVLLAELSEIKPTIFFAVPRLYNKIYDSLHKKVAAGSPIRQKLFYAAVENSAQRIELAKEGKSSVWLDFKHGLFDKVVFGKVREMLGGRMQYAFSGGAAISSEVASFLEKIGVVIFEGYGLSETSPIAAMNYPDNRKVGSVGTAIPNVELIIDTDAVNNTMGEQGEILIKGPNIMMGYHNLPEKTAAVMRDDGAFRSGDLGRLDDEGFLYITGRIKEQYKLENGKYVVPSPLENQLQLSGFIAQAMVYGHNRPFNVAVLVPDFPALAAWASEQGIATEHGSLCADATVHALIEQELEKQHASVFKGFEKIRKFRLITEEFSVDNDMLTPKMSLKRRNVIAAYQVLLDEMYAG